MTMNWPLFREVFLWLNATASADPVLIGTAKVVADGSPWAVILILLMFWFRRGEATRRALMLAGVTLAAGLAMNFMIALTTYFPRPAELGIGHTYLAHGPETSFPSDHATFLFALAFGLLLTRRVWVLGSVIFLIALATAWARVFLGVHFPEDMLGSLVISFGAACAVSRIRPWCERHLFSPVERIYQTSLSLVVRRDKHDNQ